MVAQPAPFGGRHVVRRPRDQHIVALAVQALGQRDHRVHVTTGAEGSEQNFHTRNLRCALARRPPQTPRNLKAALDLCFIAFS